MSSREEATATPPATVSPAPDRSRADARARQFAFTTVGSAALLIGLSRLPWIEQSILIPYAQLQQRLAGWAIGLGDLPVSVSTSCTGADVMALCLATIASFPAPWRCRIRGALTGLALISALNALRIGTLSLIVHQRALFETMHVYIWPAALIVFVALYVLFWMRSTRRPTAELATSREPAERVVLGGPQAKRFAFWLVALVVVYVAASNWIYSSSALQVVSGWVAATAGSIMAALGVASRIHDSVLSTGNGSYLVTSTCIASPLIPVYFAAAVALPASGVKRTLFALLGAPVFFALGVARLLVLVLPAAFVPSYPAAIHGFNQIAFGALIVILAATWSARRTAESGGGLAQRLIAALGHGIGIAIVAALVWTRALLWLVAALPGLIGHQAHVPADSQGATSMLPAFQIALLAALVRVFAGLVESGWRRTATAFAVLAAAQIVLFVALGELWAHDRFEPAVPLIRGWAVVAPLLASGWLVGLPRRSESPAADPREPLPQAG